MIGDIQATSSHHAIQADGLDTNEIPSNIGCQLDSVFRFFLFEPNCITDKRSMIM